MSDSKPRTFPSESSSQVCCVTQGSCHPYSLLEKFSNLDVLLRFLVRIRRWVQKRLRKDREPSVLTPLTPEELKEAYLACVRLSQARYFQSEIACLRRDGGKLPAKHPLTPLNPFVSKSDGILRVGGRLEHSTLTFDERHPPILDSGCCLARLVVMWAHERALHGGVRVTSSYMNQKAWIVHGRRKLKDYLLRCVTCVRLKARGSYQLMGSLPASRITVARAFAGVGIDYAGPFNILTSKGRGIRTFKGFVAIFVCMRTKALHLELAGDLTTESFLGALTRFYCRRGRPSEIWSDNGTYFSGADRELQEALRTAEIQWDLVINSLAEQGIKWQFIPPKAPHCGGLWEAGVKSVKRHLRSTIGSRNLTFEELTTVLASVELVLNSRPLTPLIGDPDDLEVLTPGHFLIGGPLNGIIEVSSAPENLDSLTHWKLVKGIRDQFWARWSREYLNTLQQRSKWRTRRRSFQVNDVVVIVDPTLLSSNGIWPLGRIISVIPSKDGLVREVIVKTGLREYKRHVTRLTLLPIAPETSPTSVSNSTDNDSPTAGGIQGIE